MNEVCSCMRCKADRYDSISKLNHRRAEMIQRCMDMLGDVPGATLEDRLTHYIGSYMALQIRVTADVSSTKVTGE